MLYKFLKLTSSVLLSLVLLSCSCATPGVNSNSSSNLVVPRASFLKIDVDLVIRNCDEEGKGCSLEQGDLVSGSGFVVKRARHHGVYVMSAAHVCDPGTYASMIAGGRPWHLEFSGLTKEKEAYVMTVLEVDHDKDICLLYAPKLERIPIKIADKRIMPGDKILNVAAPAGVLYRGAPIIIDGIYNGRNHDSGHDMYTMLVAGGSSGSPIMNEEGEVIGIVSMMDMRFPFIAISPAHEDVSEFFTRAIAYHSVVREPSQIVYKLILPELPELPALPKLPSVDIDDMELQAREWLADLF